MTGVQKNNSRAIFDAIMKNIKPEEKLIYAGAASRLADSFAEEGFEIVPTAEWKHHCLDVRCTNCGADAHVNEQQKAIKSIRCHQCGARMTNGEN